MNCYLRNRNWSDAFLPEIQCIVGRYLLDTAPDYHDMHKATDLMMLNAMDKRIAVRVRRYGNAHIYPYQFTIRAKVASGAKTELAKIVEGHGDWMFYGHANQVGDGFSLWWLLDLNAFRSALIRRDSLPIRCGDKAVGDGTSFKWFDIRSFPRGLVIASSKQCTNIVEGPWEAHRQLLNRGVI